MKELTQGKNAANDPVKRSPAPLFERNFPMKLFYTYNKLAQLFTGFFNRKIEKISENHVRDVGVAPGRATSAPGAPSPATTRKT